MTKSEAAATLALYAPGLSREQLVGLRGAAAFATGWRIRQGKRVLPAKTAVNPGGYATITDCYGRTPAPNAKGALFES